jgi:hypothetical protein
MEDAGMEDVRPNDFAPAAPPAAGIPAHRTENLKTTPDGSSITQ